MNSNYIMNTRRKNTSIKVIDDSTIDFAGNYTFKKIANEVIMKIEETVE